MNHAAYIAAYAAALHPVFLIASAVMLGAFGISWLLRDMPLRETAGAAGIGESFGAPYRGGDRAGRAEDEFQLRDPARRPNFAGSPSPRAIGSRGRGTSSADLTGSVAATRSASAGSTRAQRGARPPRLRYTSVQGRRVD